MTDMLFTLIYALMQWLICSLHWSMRWYNDQWEFEYRSTFMLSVRRFLER